MAQDPVPFGKYTLHERLASTPVADIFRATTRKADGGELSVVIKRLGSQASRDANFLTSFVDEARVASMLDHPNIAKTYEWGKHEDSLFIAMEYIRGTNLASLMQSVAEQSLRFPPTVAVHVICEVLTGLSYAHGQKDPFGNLLGLVHRDVSPPNIVLSASGEVKLVDFGLAKLANRLRATMPGAFTGKFTYMSPEQIRRKDVDARADIFSCGVVLYELLTGIKLQSKGEESDIGSVLKAVQTKPPSSVHADIPIELDELIARVMQELPDSRPASAKDLLGELGQFKGSWDSKVDAQSLAGYLVEVMSGQASQPEVPVVPAEKIEQEAKEDKPRQEKPEKPKPGFAFGEATSQWMAQGDNMEELAKIHPAPAPGEAQPAPEPPAEPEFKPPPKKRFSAGQTVMAILEGGLGKRRQLKTLLLLVGGIALVVLIVVFIISGLSGEDEIEKKEVVEEPPPAPVEAYAGAIQFKTEPDGALIFVDGDLVKPEGQPPRVMGLRAGMHRIKLVLPGYLPWEDDITFEADKPREIEKKLEERIGNVVFTSKPSKAKIYLDGELVGRTPKTVENLSAAKSHKVVLKAKGRRWEPLRFSIEPPDWPENIDEDLKVEKKLKKRKRRRRRRR
jgi:serine/threonine protein kinase